MKKKILLAPQYAMADFGESNRMSVFAKAFADLGHDVFVLGKGKYDFFFSDIRYNPVDIPFDNVWMTDDVFHKIHHADEYLLNWVSEEDLTKLVNEEIRVIEEIQPDIIITGFRPSITISAKVTNVSLVWVLSAVGSELFYKHGMATVLDGMYEKLPFLRFIPASFCNFIINRSALRIPYKLQIWNKTAKAFGQKTFKSIPDVLKGDLNLMADAPEIFPQFTDLPLYYSFCGPIITEQKLPMPSRVQKMIGKKREQPLIFFTMGSSGDIEIFKKIVKSFYDLPYYFIIATTTILDRSELDALPENIVIESFVPALEVAMACDLAIIHGGQGTVYTIAHAGIPFIGLPMFGEQQYNLERMALQGSGLVLKRDRFNTFEIRKGIDIILGDDSFRKKAKDLSSRLRKYRLDDDFYPPKVGALKILDFFSAGKI